MCDGERELAVGIVMRVADVRHREGAQRHQQNWCDRRGARTNPSQHHAMTLMAGLTSVKIGCAHAQMAQLD
jgi:hypothetical protein